MSDRIEEEMSLFTKMVVVFGVFIITINIIGFGSGLLDSNRDSTDLAFFIMFIFIGLPAMVGWGVVFLKSATKLTLENDILIVKTILFRPIIIRLSQIERVNTWGDVKRDRHFYIIKSKVKNFNTLLISFGLGRGSLDVFMQELKQRIDKAKSEKL